MKAVLLSGSENFGIIEFEREIRIGRSSRNDVVLGASRVSSEHARIWFDEQVGAFFVEDLGSRNGTVVADRPVTRPERLLPLDVITLGGAVDLVFRVVASGVSARPEGGVSGVTTVRESPLAGGPVPERTEIERPTRPPALGPGRRVGGRADAPGDTLPDAWDPGPPPGEADTEPRSES